MCDWQHSQPPGLQDCESYASGASRKAIAMYKKVSKIDPGQVQALHRLADLYLRQGLISDARTHYLQVAETLLKKNENENAASIFQKIIEVDPENPLLETRLAEVYLKLNKKNEAVLSFHAAAQNYRKKGSLDEAGGFLRKAFELDEGNLEVMLSYASFLSDSGKADEALSHLNRIQFHDFNPEVHEAIRSTPKAGKAI
jgi:predicted Zn-dependent protease